MSDTLALDPAPVAGERTSPAMGLGLTARFKALMEALVAAQTRRFEDTQPLLYRFPPI